MIDDESGDREWRHAHHLRNGGRYWWRGMSRVDRRIHQCELIANGDIIPRFEAEDDVTLQRRKNGIVVNP